MIIAEIRPRSTAVEAVRAWRSALPGPVTVGLEATLYWDWLVTRLIESGHTGRVAHAFHVKRIWQARGKTDPIDARKLAELLRVHLFPAIWLPDLDTRERRHRCHPETGAGAGGHLLSPPAAREREAQGAGGGRTEAVLLLYWMMKEGSTYQAWLQQHVDSQRSEVRPVQRMGAMA